MIKAAAQIERWKKWFVCYYLKCSVVLLKAMKYSNTRSVVYILLEMYLESSLVVRQQCWNSLQRPNDKLQSAAAFVLLAWYYLQTAVSLIKRDTLLNCKRWRAQLKSLGFHKIMIVILSYKLRYKLPLKF